MKRERMKYSQEVQEALEKSIRHWEENYEHAKLHELDQIKAGPENCPLCKVFYCCSGCPVKKRTKRSSCFNTPYYKVITLLDQVSLEPATKTEYKKLISSIHKELRFLKSLRYKGEAEK